MQRFMQYAVAFLEGIITFISPCLLPMLPIYISYFAGGGERSTKKTLLGALGFVSGFTVIFVAMGTLAGTIGSFLREYKGAVNLISGLIVILFGLNFLGIFKMNLFRGGSKTLNSREMGFFPAMLFGIIFSLGWTPCVGAFLGSALMLASQQGHVIKGMLMLLCYSLGLGIPFLLSAILIDYLKSAFNWIKKHYRIINTVSGCSLPSALFFFLLFSFTKKEILQRWDAISLKLLLPAMPEQKQFAAFVQQSDKSKFAALRCSNLNLWSSSGVAIILSGV